MDTTSALLSRPVTGSLHYQNVLALAPGAYRLGLAMKDPASGNVTTYWTGLDVPHFSEDSLDASSLILAEAPNERFNEGGLNITPRVGATFSRSEKLGVFVQLYNFAPGAQGTKPNGRIEYELVRTGTGERVFDRTEEAAETPDASIKQVTVEKRLPLDELAPGGYTMRLKAIDRNRGQSVTRTAAFTVQNGL